MNQRGAKFELRIVDIRRATAAPQAGAQRFLIGVPKSKIAELSAKPSFSKYGQDASI
jgi:hypothetical protein